MADDIPSLDTIEYRMRELGWSQKDARETPVRHLTKSDGSLNVAKIAREMQIDRPARVQQYMRDGLTLDEAIEKAWRKEGKG